MTETTDKGGSGWSWLLLFVPLTGVLAIIVYVAYGLYLESKAPVVHAQAVAARPAVKETSAVPQAVPVADDDLTPLEAQKRKAPPKPAAPKTAAVALNPTERAWKSVKSSFDLLESHNENTAKKYRMRIIALEDRKGTQAEPAFISDASALQAALEAELARPENQ